MGGPGVTTLLILEEGWVDPPPKDGSTLEAPPFANELCLKEFEIRYAPSWETNGKDRFNNILQLFWLH